MRNTVLCTAALLAACASPKEEPKAEAPAPAPAPKPILLSACANAVSAKVPGTIIRLEGIVRGGAEVYEFDVKGADGKDYDLVCDPATSSITETEVEAKDEKAAEWKTVAKVSRADAEKAALAKHAGKVVEVEYEIEADGKASYEFDIKGADGKEYKVEVDAATGQVVEDEVELFQIGIE